MSQLISGILKFTLRNKTSLLFVASLAFILSACKSMPTHQAFDGPPRASNEIATFLVPEEFNVLFINKEKYSSNTRGDGATILLLPGSHQIIVEYQDFWDLPGDDYERVESKPISITLGLTKGKRYLLQFSKPKDIDQARSFAKDPFIEIIDTSINTKVQAKIEYKLYSQNFFARFFGTDTPAADKPAEEPLTIPAPSASVSTPAVTPITTSTPAPSVSLPPVSLPPVSPPSVSLPVQTAVQTTTSPTAPSPTPETSVTPVLTPTATAAVSSDTKKETVQTAEDGRALDMLKYWWESASKDQKQHFQEWVKGK